MQAIPVEVMKQPAGLAGGRHSLATLARVAVAAQNDVNVRAWVSHLLQEEGLTEMDVTPAAQLARAQVILRWVQEKVAWLPDPKGVEHIPRPWLLLPCRDGTCGKLPFLAGDDCDGKDALLLALLLAALNTVDVPVAAIGHGYNPDHPAIEHVLAAVGGDPQWTQHYYMDPSTHLPFGKSHPFLWEQVIDLPSLRTLCDAKVCLGTANMGKIVAAIGESGGNVDVMHVVGNVSQIDPVAWARAQRAAAKDPVAWARAQKVGVQRYLAKCPPGQNYNKLHKACEGTIECPPGSYYDKTHKVCVKSGTAGVGVIDPVAWARNRKVRRAVRASVGEASIGEIYRRQLEGDLANAQIARARFLAATQAVDVALTQVGLTAGDLTEWTAAERTEAATALAAADLLIGWLGEAINGARPVVLDPKDADGLWSLDGLPGDKTIVGGNDDGFFLQEVISGQQSATVSGRNAASGIPIIIAASLGFLAIHAGAAFLVYTVLDHATDAVMKALEILLLKELNKCIAKGGTPEACTVYTKALGDARLAVANAASLETATRNKPFLETVSFGKFLVGVAALGAAGLAAKWVYEEFFKGQSKRKKAA